MRGLEPALMQVEYEILEFLYKNKKRFVNYKEIHSHLKDKILIEDINDSLFKIRDKGYVEDLKLGYKLSKIGIHHFRVSRKQRKQLAIPIVIATIASIFSVVSVISTIFFANLNYTKGNELKERDKTILDLQKENKELRKENDSLKAIPLNH